MTFSDYAKLPHTTWESKANSPKLDTAAKLEDSKGIDKTQTIETTDTVNNSTPANIGPKPVSLSTDSTPSSNDIQKDLSNIKASKSLDPMERAKEYPQFLDPDKIAAFDGIWAAMRQAIQNGKPA